MAADTIDGGNMDGAANDLLHFLQLAVELVVEIEYLFGGFEEFLTFAGQAELFLAAVNNEDIEMLFHCP